MRFVVSRSGLLARPGLCQLMGSLKWWCLVWLAVGRPLCVDVGRWPMSFRFGHVWNVDMSKWRGLS